MSERRENGDGEIKYSDMKDMCNRARVISSKGARVALIGGKFESKEVARDTINLNSYMCIYVS